MLKSITQYIVIGIVSLLSFRDVYSVQNPAKPLRRVDNRQNHQTKNHHNATAIDSLNVKQDHRCIHDLHAASKLMNDEYPEICLEAKRLLSEPLACDTAWDPTLTFADTLIFTPFILPIVFTGEIEPIDFRVYRKPVTPPVLNYQVNLDSIESFRYIALNKRVDSLRLSAKLYLLNNNPELIDYDAFSLPSAPREEFIVNNKFKELLKIESAIGFNVNKLDVGLPKADLWRTKMQSAIQFSQNFVSENWYQGGESSVNILSLQNFTFNYNDNKKIQFDNNINIKTGINTSPNDTLRNFRVSDDLFQLNTKLGVKAFNRWYYTASVYFRTQFFNSYKPNSKDKLAEFLSPGEMNAGLGMDYKYSNDMSRINYSLLLSPLSYNLRFALDNKEIDVTRFGIEKDKKSLHQIGSSFQNTLKWDISKNITWNSKIFYFTDYKKVQVDFENSFNFVLNRYFSTQIFVYLRYDDGAKKHKDSYLQMKELLSFGFNYHW